MEQSKINHFKEKLEEELKVFESELAGVGRKNIIDSHVDWEGRPADFDTDTADESELGDRIEEYEENTAVVKNLEIRYNEVKDALDRIAAGKYGVCHISGELIEED